MTKVMQATQKSSRRIQWLVVGVLGGVAIGCGGGNSTTSPTSSTSAPSTVTAHRPVITDDSTGRKEPADRTNTGINSRDQGTTAKTPLDQYENKTDIKITADIRKRIVDKKMSVDAHNVKIITQDGKVTLRGPVTTDDEKNQIETIAREVAGDDRVDDQLEVTKP